MCDRSDSEARRYKRKEIATKRKYQHLLFEDMPASIFSIYVGPIQRTQVKSMKEVKEVHR